MHFSPKSALALLGLAALGLAVPASASSNLVQDGDFETADPGQVNSSDFFTTGSPFDTNWVIGGTVGIDKNDVYVYDGQKSLFLNGGERTMDSITQNLSTVANQTYTLSFAADSDIAKSQQLNVSFGGTALAPIQVPNNGFNGPPPGNNSRFTLYSFTVTASGPFTGLTFSAPVSSSGSGLELDDIVVVPVPEASTTVSFGLLALGLGSVVGAARRKKAARS